MNLTKGSFTKILGREIDHEYKNELFEMFHAFTSGDFNEGIRCSLEQAMNDFLLKQYEHTIGYMTISSDQTDLDWKGQPFNLIQIVMFNGYAFDPIKREFMPCVKYVKKYLTETKYVQKYFSDYKSFNIEMEGTPYNFDVTFKEKFIMPIRSYFWQEGIRKIEEGIVADLLKNITSTKQLLSDVGYQLLSNYFIEEINDFYIVMQNVKFLSSYLRIVDLIHISSASQSLEWKDDLCEAVNIVAFDDLVLDGYEFVPLVPFLTKHLRSTSEIELRYISTREGFDVNKVIDMFVELNSPEVKEVIIRD